MDNVLKCRILKIYDERQIPSKKDSAVVFRMRDVLVEEINTPYPLKLMLTVKNTHIDSVPFDTFNEGDVVIARYSVRSREHNGMWFNDVEAWNITKTSE